MTKPTADGKRWPGLKEYWDQYGHSVPWDALTSYKERSDGCYVVVCWDAGEEDGVKYVGFADIAGDGKGYWSMQNDSEQTTARGWKNLRVKPYVDGFILDEEDE